MINCQKYHDGENLCCEEFKFRRKWSDNSILHGELSARVNPTGLQIEYNFIMTPRKVKIQQ